MFKTRIQKYNKLREKIDQEIRELKLKNENNAKLKHYQELLNKIDINIFKEVKEKTDKLFPDFQSLIQIEKKHNHDNWQDKKNEVKKWLEIVETLHQKNIQEKELSDYVPDTINEKFIKNITQNWKNDHWSEKNKIEEIIKAKEQFSNFKPQKTNSLDKINILKQINETNENIQEFNQTLKKIIRIKKLKSKYLFWLILTSTISSVVCLIIILFIS